MRFLTAILFCIGASLAAAQEAQQTDTNLKIGAMAPDYELKDSEGKTYKLSDFRGEKAVVLEFFRSGDW